ncbi:MAG: hypothetical protein RLZ98_1702 [Pseudomonadota bacterium]|jgi:general L-amino acid transport system substrate-binding protein
MRRRHLATILLLLSGVWAANAATLDAVKKRGELVCGVSQDVLGLAAAAPSGNWWGIEVEFCRALAAAVLGHANQVKFRPLASPERFEALRKGEVDVLARSERWTMSSGVEPGITFAAVLYHSGLAVMVPKRLGVVSVHELSGVRLCVGQDYDRQSLEQYLSQRSMRANVVSVANWQEISSAYRAEKCAGLVADSILLAGELQRLPDQDRDIVLPERLSIQPAGVMVRSGDNQWRLIVRWTMNAMILGEQLGVGASGVHASVQPASVELRVLLGMEGNLGASLGLERDWAQDVLSQVGNYAEIYARTLGTGSALRLPRGPNRLWSQGGLFVPLPLR